jgi:hypothetical protein
MTIRCQPQKFSFRFNRLGTGFGPVPNSLLIAYDLFGVEDDLASQARHHHFDEGNR